MASSKLCPKISAATKAITIQSLTEDLAQLALQEKQFFQNSGGARKKEPPNSGNSGGKGQQWRNLQRRKKPRIDKQNLQFVISPWGV